MAEINLGRVQGGGFFYSSAASSTSIAKSTLSPSGISPLVGDAVVFSNGDVRKVTAVSGDTITCGEALANFKGPKGDPGNPTIEQFVIGSTAWTSLSNADPFTVQATVTATTTIGADAIIELYNDQPVAFATYAFSIASVSGQTITFYALEAPTAQVTLSVGITN